MATKKWAKCGVTGCRKHQIKGSIYCVEHREWHRPRNLTRNLPPLTMGVLTALCAAVSAKYKEEGDKIKAGIVVACLSHDPPRYYASVARYPVSPMHKEVTCKVGHNEPIKTAEQAVEELARKWSSDNQPAMVREKLEELSLLLRQREGSAPP